MQSSTLSSLPPLFIFPWEPDEIQHSIGAGAMMSAAIENGCIALPTMPTSRKLSFPHGFGLLAL